MTTAIFILAILSGIVFGFCLALSDIGQKIVEELERAERERKN